MKRQLSNRLRRTNQLFEDFLAHIPEELLMSKLTPLPSNTVGQQIWCVVGARESYLNAAKAGKWQGFECPLTNEDIALKEKIQPALTSSCEDILKFINATETLSTTQEDYLWDLVEHEVQHHGQLIRYLYGLNAGVPQSWKERYALE